MVGLSVRHRMLRAWSLGTVGGCWHRNAHEYYVQNIWMRATEANELVWDKPEDASLHVTFTCPQGGGKFYQLLAAIRQYFWPWEFQ